MIQLVDLLNVIGLGIVGVIVFRRLLGFCIQVVKTGHKLDRLLVEVVKVVVVELVVEGILRGVAFEVGILIAFELEDIITTTVIQLSINKHHRSVGNSRNLKLKVAAKEVLVMLHKD